MNKQNVHPFGMIALSLVAILFIPPYAQAADIGDNDALLNILPEDCAFCIRINSFNGTLGKMDQYLAGASPLPISLAMMINMQLGAVLGDPMLTGIDQGGDFAFFGVFPQADQKEPVAGLLIPVTDYKTFVQTNPNCKESEGGITILASPNSPAGSFALTEAGNGKYAIVVSEMVKAKLPLLKEAINKKSKSLAQKLNANQAETAKKAPAWGYVNLADLYDKHNKDILGMLEMSQQEMAKASGGMEEMMGFVFKMYAAMFTEYVGEADSLTIALAPETTMLSIDVALQAKGGTKLAQMLVADTNSRDFSLTPYLDNNNAVNGLMKMNRPFMQKFYDKIFDVMEASTNEAITKEETAKIKALTQKMLAAMGEEVSFSYSYAGSAPPFRMQEVIEVKDAAAMKAMMVEGTDYANTLYKAMGIPAELKYEQGVSSYKDASIDVISVSMEKSNDPNNVMQKELEKMYGNDFKYYMAQTNDKLYVTMGPDSKSTLKHLIDASSATAPTGDIKIAMEALQNTPYNDFVGSINVIKLMKGMGEMMQVMKQPGTDQAAAMFSGLKNVQSQSCLVTGGSIADGQASLRLVVPKQHLTEIVAAAMQIQQQAMAAKMQNPQPNMAPQELGNTPQQMSSPAQTARQNPLQSWIGKPAPELKMVDLDGKAHRISRLKGKKVILDFWATWCPPCKKAIPDLIKLADSGNSNLVILGLSDESNDKLSAFAKKAKMNYPVVAYEGSLPAPFGQVTALPTLFLIDSKGIIQDVLVGYHEPAELLSRLNNIE